MRVFKKLERNKEGGIDGIFIKDDGTEKSYTLDPEYGDIKKAESGEWGVIAPLSQSGLDFMAAQEKVKIQNAIDVAYNEKIKAIIGNMPKWESDTFPIQASEARAYSAARAQEPAGDHSALTPNLQRLANKRGMTLDVLVSRVIIKADIYEPAAFDALGDKHAAEDLL